MKHTKITDIVDDYTFGLPTGTTRSPTWWPTTPSTFPGGVATLHVEHRPEGTTMLLVRPTVGWFLPSDVGVQGFDELWKAGFSTAYDVADGDVARLVEALAVLERGALPAPPGADVRMADIWIRRGWESIEAGFDLEVSCYVRALEIDPGSREAWNSMRNAARRAGRHDVEAACGEAMRILDAGGVIEAYRDILPDL